MKAKIFGITCVSLLLVTSCSKNTEDGAGVSTDQRTSESSSVTEIALDGTPVTLAGLTFTPPSS